jgi:hypothetical protein
VAFLVVTGARGSSSGGGGSEGFPNLQTLYGVPWAPTWPTAPTAGSTTTVNNASEWGSADKTLSTITMASGSYGDITLTGTDLDVIVQSNVTIGILDVSSCTRVRFRYETPRDATSIIQVINGPSAYNGGITSLLFDGIRTFNNGTIAQQTNFAGDQTALINSYLHVASYGIWTDQGTQRPTDLIIWNNVIDAGNVTGGAGPQSLTRQTGVEKGILAGNRLVKHGAGLMVRIYGRSDFWCSHNQIEAADYASVANDGSIIDTRSSADTGTPVNTSNGIHFRSNTNFNDAAMLNTGSCGGDTLAVTVRDNVEYGGNASAYSNGTPAGFTYTNNTDEAYEAPPTWNFA